MHMNPFTYVPERTHALAYLEHWLDVSPLVTELGISRLSVECGHLGLVCGSQVPRSIDYSSGWGGDRTALEKWLTAEILTYLDGSPNRLVLLEDIASVPGALVAETNRPPFLSFEDRVYWPIGRLDAKTGSYDEARAWCAAFREIIHFTEYPRQMGHPLQTTELDENAFHSLAAATTRIVTDVCDGECYLDWKRDVHSLSATVGPRADGLG